MQRREDGRPPLLRPAVRRLVYLGLAANAVLYILLPWLVSA
jgi:hypothetical protein